MSSHDATTPVEPLAQGHSDEQPLVLVIDHTPDVHRLLKVRLKHEELALVSAFSGAEGLNKALTENPAIILLDLEMADMDGFEVLRKLKNNPHTVQIPVIVLSGQQSPKDKATAFDLGAVDYVTKPFNLTELRVRVRSALRLYRLVQMLAQRAQIDGLTGLWNRAYFDARWSETVALASRHSQPLSLAMIDADNFKGINDTYGHPAGDAVLQGLAKVLRREIRREDVACRYGGEEFALIMPATSPQEALTLCERLRQSIAATLWPSHPERAVTVSIGLAGAASAVGVSPQEWIQAADINLYASKQSGRNRCTMSDLSAPLRLNRAG